VLVGGGGNGVSVGGDGGGVGVSVGGNGAGVSVGGMVAAGASGSLGAVVSCSSLPLIGAIATFSGVGVKVGQGVRVGQEVASSGSPLSKVFALSVTPQATLTSAKARASPRNTSIRLHFKVITIRLKLNQKFADNSDLQIGPNCVWPLGFWCIEQAK
jgi:hypothetical protein